jgi:hypothetical protein
MRMDIENSPGALAGHKGRLRAIDWACATSAPARCAEIASAACSFAILVANDASPRSLRSMAVSSLGIMQRQP